MSTDRKETKQLIIREARSLFSEQGFNGTSIRQIAEKCDINIAAINYHFGSKENLYWSIISDSFEWLTKRTEEIVGESDSLPEVVRGLFKALTKNGDYVLSMTRTYLSHMIPPPQEDHPFLQKLNSKDMGPPGSEALLVFLNDHYPKASLEAKQCVILTVFSALIHLSCMTSTSIYKKHKQKNMPHSKIEDNLAWMTAALCEQIEHL